MTSDRTAILHIGPMKTGSSSIQYWLARNADTLRAEGFGVPASTGERNLSRLARVARGAATGEEVEGDRAWFRQLGEELAALPAAVGTVVLSGETMGQRLTTPAEVRALKHLLDPCFARYRIVVYLRRQDRLAVSRYSTALRHGKRRNTPLLQSIDYEAMLAMWAEVFGREALVPRIFERADLPGGDVVRDFAAAAGLPEIGLDEERSDVNPSLRPEAQALLSDLGDLVRRAGHDGSFHDLAGVQIVDRVLTLRFGGSGILPCRARAEAFYAPYRASNERVRAAWFPERALLFDEDFSAYADAPTPDPAPEAELEAALLALAAVVLGDARAVATLERPERREEVRRARQRRRREARARPAEPEA